MSLKKYNEKRNFKITEEPKASVKKRKAAPEGERTFVIQKHGAHKLHYDLRLEIDHVLKSWAVPKGPSLDPAVKRLAIHVEDHPFEYGSFEGNIPAKQYGAGPVMLWDKGHWTCEDDPKKAYKKGDLTFQLHGTKLHGLWKLIRTKMSENDKENWLFFKLQDRHAKKNGDILEDKPLSIVSKLTLEEIADQGKPGSQKFSMTGSKKKALPKTFKPQLAHLTQHTPPGDDWLHEVKLDGYRFICIKDHKTIKLFTRNGLDWTNKFPTIVHDLKQMPIKNAILDGEIVVIDEQGISQFQLLQNFIQNDSHDSLNNDSLNKNSFSLDKIKACLQYFIFDLPYGSGFDFSKSPIIERKQRLLEVFRQWTQPHPAVVYTEHRVGHGQETFKKACQSSLEGIISKQVSSPYEQKRTRTWLKSKCNNRQEFVIGGFTQPAGARRYFGALLIGYFNEKRQFIYCGRVGTGFSESTLKTIYQRLKPLVRPTTPFHNLSQEAYKNVSWVKAALVCELKFLSWTKDGVLRHPSFVGLREDKPAAKVIREKAPSAAPSASSKKTAKASAATITLSGVQLSHPEKVLYPTATVTKLELAQYYDAVSDLILPHIINRPLLIFRCFSSPKENCFFQKHYAEAFPKDIYPVKIKGHDKETSDYLMIKNKKGLLSLIQFNVLEIHPWGSRVDRLENPDRIIFDLDPDPSVEWESVVYAALYLRKELKALGLTSFVKTSGGKGLHLVLPITRKYSWLEVKTFAKAFAVSIVEKHPTLFTANPLKEKRKNKIFIDYIRNGRNATAVAAYSTRAREGAPISAPIRWEDLKKTTSSTEFNLSNFLEHSKRKPDPWAGFFQCRQSLGRALRSFSEEC